MVSAPAEGRLYLIRHGRTAGNGSRYVGWEDAPLDAVGREQARAAAALLAGEWLDIIVASTLVRALSTALPLATGRRCPVVACPELREIHYGELQGLEKAGRRLRVRHDFRETPLPGGESLRDVYARVARIGAELVPLLAAGKRVAAVAHFWSARLLAGALLGVPFAELPAGVAYKPANGSVALLSWAPGAARATGLTMLATGEEGEE